MYLTATQDIAKGEEIVAIPYNLWMPLESVLVDSPLGQKLNDFGDLTNYLSSPWRNSFFAVFYAEQMKLGEKSKYKDYIQNLPTDFSNYASQFTDNEKAMLEGSESMIMKVTIKKTVDAQDYKLLCMAYPEFET